MKGEPNPHLMTMGSDAGQSFARAKGIAWPEVTANTRRKRGHRWAPMGLMVVAPDHVEGFIPATIKRKRPRQSPATGLRLKPLPSTSSSRGVVDSDPANLRHSGGRGVGGFCCGDHRKSDHHRQKLLENGGRGGVGDCHPAHSFGTHDVPTAPDGAGDFSPSLGILSRHRRGAGSCPEDFERTNTRPSKLGARASYALTARARICTVSGYVSDEKASEVNERSRDQDAGIAPTTAASQVIEETEIFTAAVEKESEAACLLGMTGKMREEKCSKERDERTTICGPTDGEADMWKRGLGEKDGEENEEDEDDDDWEGEREEEVLAAGTGGVFNKRRICAEAMGDHEVPGGALARSTTEEVLRRATKAATMLKMESCDAVLPMAFPGEAHEMAFGAAARAIVLASGTSRFMISRHVHGKTLMSRVGLPWRPPLRPPWRTTRAGRPGERCSSWSPFAELQQQQSQYHLRKQMWELHRAALEIQRAWRGYLARAEFWTDGGVGFHAVATRVQRTFRGWRGKVRAAEAMVEKRARAATAITSLGRGFQGRQEAKRLRVDRLNATAMKIQTHFRSRAARRWRAQLALAASIRCSGHIQAIWRGFSARRRFRVLGLRQSMEEEVLEAICLGYKGREGWADIGGSAGPKCESKPFLMPTLPEGFEIRFTDRRGVAGVESVFGGAFCPGLPPPPCQPYRVMSPRHRPTEVGVEAPLHSKACPSTTSTNSTKSGRRAIPGSDAGDADSGDEGNPCAAPEPEQARAEVPPTSPDRYFVAYGHCLLAGAGTGVSDEARERAAETNGFCGTAGSNGRPPFLGADAAARISDKKRTQGYGDALEVFQEGLRRFPTSAALLYGSSFAMQASWFTDGRGASPTSAMLEASLCLLARAWAQDPERRAYQQAEGFFLASARIARRRLLRAEAVATAAREAKLGASRPTKECSIQAGDRTSGRLRETHFGGREGETEEDSDQGRGSVNGENTEEEGEDEEEPDEVSACKKAAAIATLYVALWSQIANGNHDLDLRRAETSAAYRRVSRLYSKARELDAAFALPEIGASERIFTAFYTVKPRLLVTRPLLLKVPPHPEPASPGGGEADEREQSTLEGLDPPIVRDEAQRRQSQLQEKREQEEEQQRKRRQEQQEHEELRMRQQRQQDQERKETYQLEVKRQRQELLESTLDEGSLGSTSGTRSPKRPHVARRIVDKVVAAVREGTKVILQTSPRQLLKSPRQKSHRAAGLAVTAAAGFRDGERDGCGNSVGGTNAEDVCVSSEARAVRSSPGNSIVTSPAARSANLSSHSSPADTCVHGSATSTPVVSPRQECQRQRGQQQQQAEPHHRLVRVSVTGTKDSERAECTRGTGFGREVTALRQTPGDFPDTEGRSQAPRTSPRTTDTTKAPAQESSLAAEMRPAFDARPVPVQMTPVRAIVTAWRCGSKLILRVDQRDAIIKATGVGDGRPGGGDPTLGASEVQRIPSANNGDSVGRPGSMLGKGSCVIVVHEDEMERLVVTAVEQQVAEGRPRDVVEAEEPFRLVSEHFIGKVTVHPECDQDHRYRFSTSRSMGGRKGGFVAGLGRFSAGLPYLDAIREKQAERSARDDGARVLQRAFGGLLARSKCRAVCYELLEVMEEVREQGRRLLEEDILRQKESDAARHIQGAWKGWKLRVRLAHLKSAAKLVRRCYRRLEAKRAAEKAERTRLEGPEVLTVYHQGTIVSGVPLMLSVLRCGYSFKFVGRDQEACWAHHGYCYEFEVVKILHQHDRRYVRGHKGDTFLKGRVGPIDQSRHKKVVEMLVSRLALVDALPAPTAELRVQHRYKTLVVQTPDLSHAKDTDNSLVPFAVDRTEEASEPGSLGAIEERGLRGPGILAIGAEHGRGLRDTRALVSKSYNRYLKRQAKWEESRRKQAYMRHSENKTAMSQD